MKHLKNIFIIASVFTVVLFIAGLSFAEAPEKVNINTATVEELIKLDHVGPQFAQRIVEYRENTGPFGSPEDILNVKGIGPRTYEANKDRITVK